KPTGPPEATSYATSSANLRCAIRVPATPNCATLAPAIPNCATNFPRLAAARLRPASRPRGRIRRREWLQDALKHRRSRKLAVARLPDARWRRRELQNLTAATRPLPPLGRFQRKS